MKVLIPVDDSPTSAMAVEVVLSRVWPDDTRFKLITVVERTGELQPGPGQGRRDRREELAAATKLVEESAELLQEHFGPGSVRFEILEGIQSDLIVAVAGEWQADLIVIGSHERSEQPPRGGGNVAQVVAYKAPCSTEIIKTVSGGKAPGERVQSGENVLIVADSSALSRNILEEVVLRRCWAPASEFRLIAVAKSTSAEGDHYAGVARADRDKLKTALSRLELMRIGDWLRESCGDKAVTWSLVNGQIEHAILKEAKDWRADMIVIGSLEAKGMRMCLVGDVFEDVLSHAECSVLIVKDNAASRKTDVVEDSETYYLRQA